MGVPDLDFTKQRMQHHYIRRRLLDEKVALKGLRR